MAEIHVLPAPRPGADQITRLSADLAAAQEQGLDLGSRVSHIRVNGATLLALGQELECALSTLRQELDRLGLPDPRAEAVLRRRVS